MNKDTPETDALADAIYAKGIRVSEIRMLQHARRLERERDEARKVAEFWLAVACGPFENENALPWKDEK